MSKAPIGKDSVTPDRESTPKRTRSLTDGSPGVDFGLLVELSMRTNQMAAHQAKEVTGPKTPSVDAASSTGVTLHAKTSSRAAHPIRSALADQVGGLGATPSAVSGGRLHQAAKELNGTPNMLQDEAAALLQEVNEPRAQDTAVRTAVHELHANGAKTRANPLQSAQLRTVNASQAASSPQDESAVVVLAKQLTAEKASNLRDHSALRSAAVGNHMATDQETGESRLKGTGDVFGSNQSTAGHIQSGLNQHQETFGQLQVQQTPPTASSSLVSTGPVVHLDRAHAPTELGQLVLQQVKTGPSEMRVKVHPEGMGDIVVAVVRNGDSLHLRLEANQAQTVNWLAQHAEALVQAAKSTGVDLASVEVVFGQAQLSQGFQDDSSSRRQRDWTSRRDSAWVHSQRTDTGVRFTALDLGDSGWRVNLEA